MPPSRTSPRPRTTPARRRNNQSDPESSDDDVPFASTSILPPVVTPAKPFPFFRDRENSPRTPHKHSKKGRPSLPTGQIEYVASPGKRHTSTPKRRASEGYNLGSEDAGETSWDLPSFEQPSLDIADMPTSAGEVLIHIAKVFTQPTASRQESTGVVTSVKGFKPGQTLFPYQANALQWMQKKETMKVQGIFSDEMGLGKTRTAIALILSTYNVHNRKGPTLIVVPKSLMIHWATEIKLCTDELRILLYQGPDRHNKNVRTYDVVIVSYDVVQREYGQRSPLFSLHWFRIILDEAHMIRNPTSKRTLAIWELEATMRWAITGTPVQNKILDLFALLKFLRISRGADFGVAITCLSDFNANIAHPLEDLGPNAQGAIRRVHFLMSRLMLRRVKTQVYDDSGRPLVQLPTKTITLCEVELTEAGRKLYNTIEERMGSAAATLTRRQDQKELVACVYVMILRLRQLCIHPQLVLKGKLLVGSGGAEDTLDLADKEEQGDEDEDVQDDDAVVLNPYLVLGRASRCGLCSVRGIERSETFCRLCKPIVEEALRSEMHLEAPAKFVEVLRIMSLIRNRNSEDKTIIYSTFVTTLRLLESHLKEQGIRFQRFDGTMSQYERQDAMTTLATDPDVKVILVSLMAGGQGLNMISCNNVILMDPWWNPAVEAQAFDRVHRIGQTKDVHVYKIKTNNTIEDRILALQYAKQRLADAALNPDSIFATERLTKEQLLTLLRPPIPSTESSSGDDSY